jgi:hypothetical protein
MPEEGEQDDDRQRHTEQQQQNSATHDFPPQYNVQRDVDVSSQTPFPIYVPADKSRARIFFRRGRNHYVRAGFKLRWQRGCR